MSYWNLLKKKSGLHDIPFVMLLLTMFGPRKRQKVQKFLIQKVEKTLFTFTVHGLLFMDYYSQISIHWHYSLLLFMTLFTPKFCLFKGGCPLSLDKFLLQNFLPLELLPLESLLRKRIHHTSTTTTLFTTNLVTRTSSGFVIVNLYCWDSVFTITVSIYSTFNNKYFQFYVHYSTCCYRHLGRITAITDGSKLLSFTLNYFHIYCLAGSTALLLFLLSSYLFYVHYFHYIIHCALISSLQLCVPFPLYGIKATLF